MYYRQQLAGILAMLVSLVGVQPASFAGQGKLLGHVVTVGHHHTIRQPDPPKQSVPMLNVRDFGATGNGVTDDTAAIQNCFNAAQANGEGVLFPAGTYLHASTVTANSIPIFGVGGASVLLANNPLSTAVILTGVSPSIQNIVVNSVPASTGGLDTIPTHATILINAAQGFVVQGITVAQGPGRVGTYLQQSAVGNVSSVTYTLTGSQGVGVFMDGCADVSLLGNLFLNEQQAIVIGVSSFLNNSIAVIGNSISTTASAIGLNINSVVVADIAQNQIQLGSTTGGVAMIIAAGSSNSVTQNVTSGGSIGLDFSSNGTSNTISQNIIRNCGSVGAIVVTGAGTGNVPFLSNQFGECGTGVATEVIQLQPGTGPNDITVFNNVYEGHTNMLTDFILSTAHLNFVSGNTQTQTALPNNLP